jgi:hypothetical protein
MGSGMGGILDFVVAFREPLDMAAVDLSLLRKPDSANKKFALQKALEAGSQEIEAEK